MKDQWIPTQNGLPAELENVVFVTVFGSTHFGFRDDECWYEVFNGAFTYIESGLVTHWLKIPELPEQHENKIPCNQCQGGGCPVCGGSGYLH